jgi:hypothetical protein
MGIAPGPVTVKVAALIVAAFIASLNVAERRVFTGTVVAPLGGTVEMTVGAPVVKVHTKFAAKVLPPGSCAPAVMLAV